MSSGIVAVLTDFGDDDAYVGIMEAVMLGIDPRLRCIRLTQNVPPQNIPAAAYIAATSWRWLPEGSVLLMVVDPGVGSNRRELIVSEGGKWLVCPDNGLSTLLLALFPAGRCYRLDAEIRSELANAKPRGSNTFDGRDLFAPVAARLASGGIEVVGAEVEPVRHSALEPVNLAGHPGGRIVATVLHTDHFGNCITSILAPHDALPGGAIELCTGGHTVAAAAGRTFSDVAAGEAVFYPGSAGFFELAVRNGNAAELFGIESGAEVTVSFLKMP